MSSFPGNLAAITPHAAVGFDASHRAMCKQAKTDSDGAILPQLTHDEIYQVACAHREGLVRALAILECWLQAVREDAAAEKTRKEGGRIIVPTMAIPRNIKGNGDK